MPSSHHQRLAEKHAFLEQRIHLEELRPAPDDVLITQWKKAKLQIKDQLASN